MGSEFHLVNLVFDGREEVFDLVVTGFVLA